MTVWRYSHGSVTHLLALVLIALPLSGDSPKPAPLDPAMPMRHYVHQTWTEDSALPETSILCLAQTLDGYLWIGSEEGLMRFDGHTFTKFRTVDTPGLAGNYIEDLLGLRDGSLLIATTEGGLSLLRDGRLTAYGTAEGLLSENVSALLESSDGTIWIGTAGGLHAWDGTSFRAFTEEDGLPSSNITALAEDAAGDLWVATSANISRFDGARFTTYDPAEGAPVEALLIEGGALWIGTKGGGLVRLEDGRFTTFTTDDGLSNDHILSLAQGAGAIWIGTNGGGINRYAAGTFSSFGSDQGLTGENVWTVLVDRDGSVWSGGLGGLNQFKSASVLTYDTRDGLSHDVVLPIMQTSSGDVWVGTAGGGVNRYRNGSFESFTTRDGLASNIVLSLLEETDGSILIATGGGIDRFDRGRLSTYEHSDQMLQAIPQSLHRDRHGALWIGTTDRGIIRLQEGRADHFTTSDGVAGNGIMDIHEDRHGVLWFASDDGGLTKYVEGRFNPITKREGLPTNILLSITEGSDGSLWIGSVGGGLIRLLDDRITAYGPKEGLFDQTVYRVLEDDFGQLWLSSTQGISSVPLAALNDLDAGRIRLIRPQVFDRNDGMKSRECNGGVDPAGWKMQDGTLWFPTMAGIAVLDPATIAKRSIPPSPVVIERVLIDGTPVENQGTGAIERLSGEYNIEIIYTSPTLYDPDNLEFRYQLEGFDPSWVEAGNRRAAYYTHLPPGNYRFQVMVINPDGQATIAGDPIELHIRPRLIQRPLFYIVLLMAVAAAAFLIYRQRIRTYTKRQSELLALIDERARAEEALRQSERHFRSLIENASDMILALDREGRIRYASPSVERVLGHEPEQLQDREFSEYLHPEDVAETMVALREKTSSSSALSTSFRLRHRDGSWRSLEAVARKLFEPGIPESLVVNLRDVTDRNLLQNQLEQANRLTSLGKLAATIAHEFNNVLMGVQPFVELIHQKRQDDPLLRDSSRQISAAIKRGKQITGEVLRYANPRKPTLERVIVADWLRDLEPELRALAGAGVEIVISVEDDNLSIIGDVVQLSQVLINLVLNARQAIVPETGTIEIEARAPGPGERFPFGVMSSTEEVIHLSVRDSGSGMSEEVRRHVFDPLFTTKKTYGTGLGLTVAHQVIHGHGGQIFVESTPGEGTTFHLFLPEAPASDHETPAVPAPESAVPDEQPATLRGKRVLLVEDNDSVRVGIESLLKTEGLEVSSVFSGKETVAAIERNHPDVVILDLGLPDVDGVTVYEEIEARWPHLPVIFSTGHGDQIELKAHLSRPNVGFLLKPYHGEALFDEIRRRIS